MSDDGDIKQVLDNANLQLAMLDGDISPEALEKKIAINGAKADLLYSLADAAKAQGNDKAYWGLHDAANEAWSEVVATAHDLDGDSPLTVEEAAELLTRQRSEKGE